MRHFAACILAILVLLCAAQPSSAADSMQDFVQLVRKDSGLTEDQKNAWIEAVRPYFSGKPASRDAGRLIYATLNQAACNEVDIQRAAAVALNLALAVEKGAPEQETSDLALYAFVEDLAPREIVRFAQALQVCNKAGVPLDVSQEMIRTSKEEVWEDEDFEALISGLAAMAQEGRDARKAALFMIVSMAQHLGAPQQILHDARKALPVLKPEAAPEPAPPKIKLDYDTFRESVESFLGTPYVWGGNTRRGVDCSGFTKLVFRENGYAIPRVSRDQAKTGRAVKQKDLKLGDLVFFDTKGEGYVTHVGFYLGGNLMAHASSSKGVIIVLFSNRYFQSRYKGARRIVAYENGR